MNNYKEILLAVVGTSPQVLTETLFYYTHPYYRSERTFDEIKVITTTKGKEELVHNLLKRGILGQMIDLLDVSEHQISFSENDIILLKDDKGKDLVDVREDEDNLNSFNTIFETMKNYTNDMDARITVLSSGGRKTMSSMIALSFQFFAREQDEIVHIMAPESKISWGKANDDPDIWYYPLNPENEDEVLTM